MFYSRDELGRFIDGHHQNSGENHPLWKGGISKDSSYHREYFKIWRDKNRERDKQRKREWILNNPEKCRKQSRVQSRRWRERHPEKSRECKRKWAKRNYELNTDKIKIESLIRNCQRRAVEGKFSYRDWESLKKKVNYTCSTCGIKEPKIKLSIDHIIPISKGGTNYIWNIQPLCLKCNLRKHDKILVFDIESKRRNGCEDTLSLVP